MPIPRALCDVTPISGKSISINKGEINKTYANNILVYNNISIQSNTKYL